MKNIEKYERKIKRKTIIKNDDNRDEVTSHAMLCISAAAYAIVRCPSVRLAVSVCHVHVLYQSE